MNGMQNVDGLCAWCKKSSVGEPNSFASISCGALLIDPRTGDGGPDKMMEAYFSMGWHGAHSVDGGKGEFCDTYYNFDIAQNVKLGQIGILFCSTKCLREFLNHAVDEIEKERNKQ